MDSMTAVCLFYQNIHFWFIDFSKVSATEICAGCPSEANIEEYGELADKMKEDAKNYFSTLSDKSCQLKFLEAVNFSTQVVAGTIYRFDAKFSLDCGGDNSNQIKTCKNFKFFQPLPYACDKPKGQCLEIMNAKEIECE